MSVADEAYQAALEEIEQVKAAGQTAISFDAERFRALDRIPDALSEIEGLNYVDLDKTHVSDLTPLAQITGLQELTLNQTQVSDLAPLARITGLQTLSLTQTQVSDLTPLARITGLQTLSLTQTQVSDLTPLARITGLRMLYLTQTQVSDLAPLAEITGLRVLSLDQTQVSDLAPLAQITGLQALYLDQTQVSDLAPLAQITGLQELWLTQTQVSDLTPLARITGLQALSLNQTQVSDLAPLAQITGLRELSLDQTQVLDLRSVLEFVSLLETPYPEPLAFADTAATRADAELDRLSRVADGKERVRETFAYLRTLPPWPEPLPWTVPSEDPPDAPPVDFAPAAIPVVRLTEDMRVDLSDSPPTADDLSDPIKEKLYGKLPDAVQQLIRFRNRYTEIGGPTDALRDLVAADFSKADMLDIHLQIAALTDVKDANDRKPEIERLDADCLTALNGVLRLGPPITMGHPDVVLFEQRNLDYANTRKPATVAAGERRYTKGLVKEERLATERTRRTAETLSVAGDTGRVASHRNDFVRNVTIALGAVAGALGDAAIGYVPGTVVANAIDFLLVHKDAIMAVAPSWGETGYKWAEYLLMRANAIYRDAKGGEPPHK